MVTGAAAEVAGLVAVWRVVGTVVAGLVTEGAGAGAEPEPATVKSIQDS